MPPRTDLAVLLTQTDWVRTLARTLASDIHQAEDLVQDAWVAALEHPPHLDRPVRGWLASVLRRRWLDLVRARGRRDERERTAALDGACEAWPSSHDVVERASVQRELVEAVLELDEPYRTTVLLRFFEDMPQREIARRMQTSAVTVNSRLTRALSKLRERMSRGRGRGAWLHVLVPLLREPATVPAVALGALAMKVVLVSVVVAASVVAGIVFWKGKSVEAPVVASMAPLAEEPSAELARSAPAPLGVETPLAPPEPRVPVVAEARESDSRAPGLPGAPPKTVTGRVLDASGFPLAGIALALSANDSKAACTSGAGGWFEIALDVPAEAVVSADERWATVLAGSARVHAATQPTVVVARSLDLSGRVVDEAHAPLAGAVLALRLPEGFGAEWGFALDYSLPQRWRTRSLADGRFELRGLPAVEGAFLAAALAGYVPHNEVSPPSSTAALEIVLARPGEAAGLVHGIVLDPDGERVEAARVSAGVEIASTNARGEFALDVRSPGTRARVVALKAGLLPAVFEPDAGPNGELLWPSHVVLQLGGPAGTIAGRVVDADGSPIGGAKVWIDDPTPFGRTADARLVAESLVRGDERFWSFELTGTDGSFELGGLFPRAYRLQAVDPRTLASVESAPVSAADSPVELRLPTDDVYERVAGRVVSAAGQPIAGVNVSLLRITYELEHEDGTDNESEESEPVVTGADGAFEFRNVSRNGVDVLATGDRILGAAAFLAREADPRNIEIVASLRLHLQVELDEPLDRADSLRVFDVDGRRVLLSVFHGRGAHADFEMPILDGRSAVFSVEERAALVELYRGGETVARLPLDLSPGATNVVRY